MYVKSLEFLSRINVYGIAGFIPFLHPTAKLNTAIGFKLLKYA